MNGMPSTMITSYSQGVPISTERKLANELSFQEMTMGTNGSVMTPEEKVHRRRSYGYCISCQGLPVLLFDVQKSRINPLWVNKKPRDVAGECKEGTCFVCHPEQDPHRRSHQPYRGSRPRISPGGPGPVQSGSGRQSYAGQITPRTNSTDSPSETRRASIQEAIGISLLANDLMNSPLLSADCSLAVATPVNSSSPKPAAEAAPPTPPRPNGTRKRNAFPSIYVPDAFGAGSGHNDTSSQASVSASADGSMANNARANSARSQSSWDTTTTTNSGSAVEQQQHQQQQEISDPESLQEHRKPASSRQPSERSMISSVASQSELPPPSTTTSQPQQVSTPTPTPTPPPAATSAAAAREDSLSPADIDGILDGVESLVREMVAVEGTSEFLAEVVLGTMREHSSLAVVQVFCLRLIWDICKDDDDNKQSIMMQGATDDIMRALLSFPENAAVQEKGCGAIWSLGVSANNRIVLVRAGACVQFVKALQGFIATESLVRAAIGAMRTLSPELEAREFFKNLKASKVTAEAMAFHRSCASIQRDGCAFLSNCAVNIEKQFVAAVPLEEIDAIVQAIAEHRDEVTIMEGGCFALKNYTHEEKNCRTLRFCNGIDELMVFASQFEASPSAQGDASVIMERMQLSKIMDESIEDQAYMALLHIVDSQDTTPQASRSILDFMRNYDWSPRLVASGLQMFRRIIYETKSMAEPQQDRLYDNNSGCSMLKDILQFCQKFERNEYLCEEACGLIALLAAEEKRHSELIEAGVCNVLFKSLEFRENEQLVKHALKALKLMATNFECFNQVKDKMHLVTDAIKLHDTSEEVQMNGIAVVSSLDYFQG